ncbi:hypothetical protein HKX48_007815 [Thoreauomyces humboldtii]|nr:hypothetical protein HKX48_007815 [Thoreauomyces humboldtii]
MAPVAVSRVFTEPRRPQRRHFVDMDFLYPEALARASDLVVVETGRHQHLSLQADHATGPSTYTHDYTDAAAHAPPPRMVRPSKPAPTGAVVPSAEAMYCRSLRDGDYVAGNIRNRQIEADRIAYVSSYQEACKDRIELPDIPAGLPKPAGKSLYQESYASTSNNPNPKLASTSNPWGKTKLLYVPKSKGTIRDLFDSPPDPSQLGAAGTSYRSDYQTWPVLDDGPGPAKPMNTLAACRTVVPKAFKYRRWGGWAGDI